MRIAYADPPYPGCAHLYKGHADYAGEVDHDALAEQLRDYDGWILHTSVPAAYHVETCLREAGWTFSDPLEGIPGEVRKFVWVKPFAAFKRNVSVAAATVEREPILIRCEGGWAQGDHDHWFTPYQDSIPPGRQSGTYFKSVRTTDDGREIWTYGSVDAETLASGYRAS